MTYSSDDEEPPSGGGGGTGGGGGRGFGDDDEEPKWAMLTDLYLLPALFATYQSTIFIVSSICDLRKLPPSRVLIEPI